MESRPRSGLHQAVITAVLRAPVVERTCCLAIWPKRERHLRNLVGAALVLVVVQRIPWRPGLSLSVDTCQCDKPDKSEVSGSQRRQDQEKSSEWRLHSKAPPPMLRPCPALPRSPIAAEPGLGLGESQRSDQNSGMKYASGPAKLSVSTRLQW